VRRLRPGAWLGPRGIVLLVVAALVADVGARLQPWPLVVLVLGSLVGLAFVLDAAAGAAAFGVTRSVPTRIILAQRAALRYTVENRARVALRFGIVEAPAARLAFAPVGVGGRVAARSRTEVELPFVPRERGRTQLSATYAWYETAAGLVRYRVGKDDPHPLRVLPDLGAIDASSDLALRTRLIEHGLRRMRRRGIGSEPAGLREYAPGDPFRAIDWKATARRQRVMVIEREIERSQHLAIVLDAGRLMAARIDDRRKLDFAVAAGLALATLARLAGDRVALHAFAGRTLAAVPPGSGPAHAAVIVDALTELQPQLEESDYERAVLELRARQTKRSLIVVFTDLFDPIASSALLAALGVLTRHHLVVLALMNDAAIAGALATEPRDAADAYRASVAARLAAERDRAVAQLRARGLLVVDVPAARLSLATLDAYVELKTRAAL
jgi:uncharacterized protein (DUF58 family)